MITIQKSTNKLKVLKPQQGLVSGDNSSDVNYISIKDYITGSSFTHNGETGFLTTMKARIDNPDNSRHGQAAIYSKDSALEGTLIKSTNSITVQTTSGYEWIEFPFSTPYPKIQNGESYWLVVFVDGSIAGDCTISKTLSTGLQIRQYRLFSSGFPTTISQGVSQISQCNIYSLYNTGKSSIIS